MDYKNLSDDIRRLQMKKSENKKTSTSWQLFSAIIILLVYLMGATGSLQAQTATKLQVLMPGMTAAPGTPSGYTGSPFTQTLGVPFQVIVNATDDNWNVISVSDLVQLTASDPYAID